MSNTREFKSLTCNVFDVQNQLDMCGFAITNISAPTTGTDAARQVDAAVATNNISTKLSCRLTSISNIADFSTKATVEAALDTISASAPTLSDGDRILVRAQSTTNQNGIYQWNNGGGLLQRADDADGSTGSEVSGGDYTFVTEGDANENSGWILTGSGQRNLGVDAIEWSPFTGTGTTSHTTLSNIGSNTHDQIDTHISTSNTHFLESSIDHTVMLNIGTNTHAQIDSHIASTSNPHNVTFDQLTPTTTKGDLIVRDTSSDIRVPVGSDGQILVADSAQSSGVAWQDSPSLSTTNRFDVYENISSFEEGPCYYTGFNLSRTVSSSSGWGSALSIIPSNSLMDVTGGFAAIGAPFEDTSRGSVHIYQDISFKSSATFLQELQGTSSGDLFGTAIVSAGSASDGTHIFVGAPRASTNSRGQVSYYRGNTSTNVFDFKSNTNPPSTITNGDFGIALDCDTFNINYILVGYPGNNSAYCYFRNSGNTLSLYATYTGGSGFGKSVAFGDRNQNPPNLTIVGSDSDVRIFNTTTAALLYTINSSQTDFGETIRCRSNTLLVGSSGETNIYHFENPNSTTDFVVRFIQTLSEDTLFGAGQQKFDLSPDGTSLVYMKRHNSTNTNTPELYTIETTSVSEDNSNPNGNTLYFRHNELEPFSFSNIIMHEHDNHLGAYLSCAFDLDKDVDNNNSGNEIYCAVGGTGTTARFKSLEYQTPSSTNLCFSKDGQILCVAVTHFPPDLAGLTNTRFAIYQKNGTSWDFLFVASTGRSTTLNTRVDDVRIGISDLYDTDKYQIVVYLEQSGTKLTEFYRWVIQPGAATQITNSYIGNFRTAYSEPTYTPTTNSYVSGLDIDVIPSTGNAFIAMHVKDTSNSYIRILEITNTGTVSSSQFTKITASLQNIESVECAYNGTTVVTVATLNDVYYVYRGTAAPQTISSGSTYSYIAGTNLNGKRFGYSSDASSLLIAPIEAEYRTLPSTFAGSNARFDLWSNNGTTYDFVRPCIIENPTPLLAWTPQLIHQASTDGTKAIATINGSEFLIEHDDVSAEWNIMQNFTRPYFYRNQAILDDSVVTYIASSYEFDNVVTRINGSSADRFVVTEGTDKAEEFGVNEIAKERGSSVGSIIVTPEHRLHRVMNVATRALDPLWLDPLSLGSSTSPVEFHVEENTNSTNTSTGYSVYLTTTPELTGGTYLIKWYGLFGNSNTNDRIRVRWILDNVVQFENPTSFLPFNSNERFGVAPIQVVSLTAGTTNFRISYNTTSGGTANFYFASITGIRLGD